MKKIIIMSLILAANVYSAESQNEIKLGESIITSATGFETSVRDLTSTPKVVTSEEIEQKQYTSIDEVLKDIPGVDVIYNSSGKPIISMRGQGFDTSWNYRAANNVKVLIDGIATDGLDMHANTTPISGISMSSIERIEVIPGGGSVLYGSGTVGGIINIITKQERTARVNVDTKYGTTLGNQTNVNLGHSIDKFDFDLTYSKENKDGYRDYDEADIESFVGKVKYNIDDKQSVMLKYSNIVDEDSYADELTKQEVEDDRTQSGWGVGEDEEGNIRKNKIEEYTLSYTNKLTSDFEFDFIAYTKTTETTSKTWSPIWYHPVFPGVPQGGFKRNYTESQKEGFKIKGRYLYSEGSSAIFGMEYKSDDLEQKTFKATQDAWAVFALNNYKLNKFNFIQGIRYEKADSNAKRLSGKSIQHEADKTYDDFAYELSGNYKYSDTGSTYIKYEKSFLLPPSKTLINRYPKPNNDKYYLSNVKPENSNTFEIGVRDRVGGSIVSAVAYYTVTQDELTGKIPFSTGEITYYNIGETVRKGIDLTAEQNLGKLTLRESYSYVDAKINEGRYSGLILDGTKMSNVAENKFKISANYELTDRILIMGDVTYTGGMYVGNGQKTGYSLGRQNENIVANLRLAYNVNDGLNLYAGINNLFDEKYYNSVSQEPKSSDGFAYDPAAERNYYAGFSYSL